MVYSKFPFPFVELIQSLLQQTSPTPNSSKRSNVIEPSPWLLGSVIAFADKNIGKHRNKHSDKNSLLWILLWNLASVKKMIYDLMHGISSYLDMLNLKKKNTILWRNVDSSNLQWGLWLLISYILFLESLSVSDAADFLSVLKTLLPHLPAGVLESNNDSDSDNSDEEDSVVNKLVDTSKSKYWLLHVLY